MNTIYVASLHKHSFRTTSKKQVLTTRTLFVRPVSSPVAATRPISQKRFYEVFRPRGHNLPSETEKTPK